jgi:hypothetical protein
MVVRALLTLYFTLATLTGPLLCCCSGGSRIVSRVAAETSRGDDADCCPCCRGSVDQSKPAPIPEPCRCSCPLKDRPTAVVEKAQNLNFPAAAFAEPALLEPAPVVYLQPVNDTSADADRDPPSAPSRLAVLCQYRC